MMDGVVAVAGSAVLFLGLALASIGLLGMLRRPAIFEQLHAAGLVSGPAVILVLVASLATGSAEIATSGVLVIAFVLVTSSLSTHAIALAAWRGGISPAPATSAAEGDEQAFVTNAREPLARPAMRVLVAHGGTPDASVAITLAASLPWPHGSELRVIGAIEGDLDPMPGVRAPDADRTGNDLLRSLEASAVALRRPGLTVDHVVRRGEAAAAIAGEARAFGADLVVVGSRGLGQVRMALLGSVAAAVLDAAPCPVLVARQPTMRRVLLATDGSPQSAPATDAVARWRIFEDVHVDVVTVATARPPAVDPATSDDGRAGAPPRSLAIANEDAATLRAAGRDATPHVVAGDPGDAIVAFAGREGSDLIVLGSRGRTGLRRALLGSVARDVVSSSDASVLVVTSTG